MNTDPIITDQPITPAQASGSLKSRLHLHQQFPSELMDEKRDFIIYLPPLYESEPDRRYPTLYLQDGQNLFDPDTSFIPGKYWRVGETADELIMTGAIEPLLIVGIYNTGERRIDEYTHIEDNRLGGGRADAYGQMLVNELKPFVDRHYRTLPGIENCALGGSSLGGLVSMYLALCYSWVFGKLAVMSPSVWWRNRAILETVAQIKRKPELRIWLDIGTQEGQRALLDARALKTALVNKRWKLGEDLCYTEIEGGHHDEVAWSHRVAPMLKFLFPLRR
jgi:predicted alpha/beta superfamily hydrolase